MTRGRVIVVGLLAMVILGALAPKGFILGALIIAVFAGAIAVMPTVAGSLRDGLREIPFEVRYSIWLVLTVLASVGAISYWLTGIRARFINTSVYFVALFVAVLYMHGREIAPRMVIRVALFFWAMLTIASTMVLCGGITTAGGLVNLIPLRVIGWIIGLVLALIDIILFWDLAMSADRDHDYSTSQPNGSTGSTRGNQRRRRRTNASGIVRLHARVPFLRIPIPGYYYTFDPVNQRIIRERFVFIGKGVYDPELWKNIHNVEASDEWNRRLLGCFRFSFQSTKIREVEYREWNCIPVALFDLFDVYAHY